MSHINSRVDRILRFYCANDGCPNTYDYTGNMSPNGAVLELTQNGWYRHITGNMQCPDHIGTPLVVRVEMERR